MLFWYVMPEALTYSGAALVLVLLGGCLGDRGVSLGLPPTEGTGGAGGGALFETSTASGSTGSGEVVIEDPDGPCDYGLDVAEADPVIAAAALGLCKRGSDSDWGLLAASWVQPDGKPPTGQTQYHLGHGLLEAFGTDVKPFAGERMLALSSGTARAPSDPGWRSPSGFDKGYSGNSPEGFPKESEACPGVLTGRPFDGVALELRLRAPKTAHSYTFRFNFFTYEWPDYICTPFNDFFVALVDPVPEGLADGNISFDQLGNPVSVNNAFLEACACTGGPPCWAPPEQPKKKFTCDLGALALEKTGFEARAATGWLSTKAPVEPGAEITLRLAVYDSGDGILDSTVLIDDFRWLGDKSDLPQTVPDGPK